ncbi:MAG TPA: type II toxin-antitoxin system VapC family toxin, partial [Candidatus Aquilonibacter sp.]|nr:type II toxin-antitoxin system VapC family toxin [Candidatus Aquilonibacter sp.]
MTILDTNVVSEFMLRSPSPKVIGWLDRQPRSSLWTTAVTIFEIRLGLQIMPSSKRREVLNQRFDEVLARINEQIVPFDTDAAQEAAFLMASRKMQGRPRDLRDAMIAGIVLSRRASLATRNAAHFDDISAALIDPWN